MNRLYTNCSSVQVRLQVDHHQSRPKQYCLKMMATNPVFTHGIEKLCTICLLIFKDTDSRQSIFCPLEEFESPPTVLQVLKSFSNFKFYYVRQMVCTTCYGKSIEVYKFIQMCNKANDHIENYFKYEEEIRTRTDSNYEDADEMEVDLKSEEIDISPTAITIDGRKLDEIIISSADIKIEERRNQEGMDIEQTNNNEESSISNKEIVTEEETDSSELDNLRVEKIDAQMLAERIGLIKSKDCHLVFSDKKELTQEKPFLSELSKASFRTKYNLRSHDHRLNQTKKKQSARKSTGAKEHRHPSLKDHDTDVVCPESRSNTHTRVHSRDSHNEVKVKAHRCEQCDRRFTQAANLRRHMDIHNGIKAHKCEQCDRRLTRAGNLRSHMHIHNGIKAHKCEQCDRRFTQASHLRRHMTIHNRKLSYKCEQCDKQFAVCRTLIAHQLAHQQIHTANTCTICDKPFDSSSALKKHFRSHIVNKKEHEQIEETAVRKKQQQTGKIK